MSAFLEKISNDSEAIRLKKIYGKDPFHKIIARKSGYSEIFGFKCDESYIETNTLKKLKKYVKYYPLNEVSSNLSERHWFTVCCVCEKGNSTLVVSDLHRSMKLVMCKFIGSIKKHDIIAISNSDVGKQIVIKNEDSILRIGHCSEVDKCIRFSEKSEDCSCYIDKRNGSSCDFHCNQMFLEAGKNRMFLKQTTIPYANQKTQSNDSILNQPPLKEYSEKAVETYIVSHPNGRGSKMVLNQRDSAPIIGKGFTQGDTIVL